ncbi:putative sulfate exporter family transporter [Leifsonia bigeumensis]|uniref:Sulfate exporter family transporter n=1 Tax=Leifsonella bigeumensis TaxID=433643 RepID=A0ABP7FWD7_9MICO
MTGFPAVTRLLPGLAAAAAAVVVAFAVHTLVPAVPLLTASVALGILVAQLPFARAWLDGPLAPGLHFAAKTLMRAGIVLLGLKLSLVDIGRLGWLAILVIVALVIATFFGTWWLGRMFRLPGDEPLLVAAGFAICGASAIGAMGSVTGSRREEQATPVALVTLCGTLAIAVLPLLQTPLGLTNLEFGHWVGAGVHDVGQVVATAQIAGPAALAIAVVVKLTRVLMLAPMVAGASLVVRRRSAGATASGRNENEGETRRPAIVPLFVAGFLAAVLLNSFVVVPAPVLAGADAVQTVLLAAALFGLGSAVRFATLVKTGARSLAVGGLAWLLVAALALAAVRFA